MQEEKPLTAAEAALRGFAESVPTLLKYATSCAVTILERTADRLLISLDATEDDGRIFDEQWSAYTDRARSLGLVSRLLRVKREGGRMHGAELFVCTGIGGGEGVVGRLLIPSAKRKGARFRVRCPGHRPSRHLDGETDQSPGQLRLTTGRGRFQRRRRVWLIPLCCSHFIKFVTSLFGLQQERQDVQNHIAGNVGHDSDPSGSLASVGQQDKQSRGN